jgi:signal transduction histidine kinase
VLKISRRVSGACGDALLAVLLCAMSLTIAGIWPGQRPLDLLGVLPLGGGCLALAVRRRWPLAVLCWSVALLVPYQFLHYRHEAAIPAALVALYTVGRTGGRRRSITVTLLVAAIITVTMPLVSTGGLPVLALTGALGWVAAAVAAGYAVRNRRAYVEEILDRAERAEHTREHEAQRAVTQERLRIARDLHDLLAHSITLIGVQSGVAAHLVANPARPVDRAVLTQSLDTIAQACRDARQELRATLSVLRETGADPLTSLEALPSEAGLAQLVDSVRATGLSVGLQQQGGEAPLEPAVGAALYRITQEALTNVIKHSGADQAHVTVERLPQHLRITVTDNGSGGEPAPGGYGILGMTERARSVGGALTAGPRRCGGFAVTALLPLHGREEAR